MIYLYIYILAHANFIVNIKYNIYRYDHYIDKKRHFWYNEITQARASEGEKNGTNLVASRGSPKRRTEFGGFTYAY